jgi:predicted permease
MEVLLQDLRYGLRMLVKSPGFTVVAILTLALGIGANTAVFSVIDAVMLKMLPVSHPEQLAVVGNPSRIHSTSNGTPPLDLFSYPLYRELRDGTQAFSGLFASGDPGRLDVQFDSAPASGESSSGETAERTYGRVVSGNYFSVLGVNPLIGRTLGPSDDTAPGANPVAVISYGYWKRRFNLDPTVVGSTVRLNKYPFTVIGVTQPGFDGEIIERGTDIWIPMSMQAQVMRGRDYLEAANTSWLQIMGRLKPGVSVAQAASNANTVFRQGLSGPYGARLSVDDRAALEKSKEKIEVSSGGAGLSYLRHEFKRPLLLLMGVVGLVLLIACVNVANLLLARASGRSKEIAVRMAIGARPLRLVRQLLTESVLLALCGGLLGVLLAQWGATLLVRTSFGAGTVRALDIHPDAHILAFTAGVCLLAGILFGLAPALRALGIPVSSTLKEGARGGTASGSAKWSTGKVLVAAQVTLSLLVLFAAGLLVRTLRNLQDVDFGYEREHLIILRPDFIAAGYKHEQLPGITQRLLEPMSAIPGVVGATVSENGLFSGTESADNIKMEGYTASRDEDNLAYDDWVGPDYFKIVGIPILLGRGIGPQDVESATKVAVINETMAKFYFPGVNPIGRKFVIDDGAQRQRPLEVVGVCKDFRDHSLREAIPRRFFLSYNQSILPDIEVHFILRVAGDPKSIMTVVRQQLKDFDPNVVVREADTLNHMVDDFVAQERLVAQLSSLFAGLALLLACVGLYGVMSYTVSGRTREIGVRMALGAQRRDVLWMVLREALILVGVGVVVGIPAALGTSRLLQNMLYALSSVDPLSMSAAVSMLLLVAAIAGYIPARRATKVDPMVALRYE